MVADYIVSELFLTTCARGDRLSSWEIPSMWLVQLCLIAWLSLTADLRISPGCICTCGCLPVAAFKKLPNVFQFASAFECLSSLSCANLLLIKQWGNRVPSAGRKNFSLQGWLWYLSVICIGAMLLKGINKCLGKAEAGTSAFLQAIFMLIHLHLVPVFSPPVASCQQSRW